MRIDGIAERPRALTAMAAAVRRGDVVATPTEHVYALAADAFRGTAALRRAKHMEPHVALPILVASTTMVQGIALVRPLAMDFMTAFWPGELTLMLPPQPTLAWDATAGGPVAVRMPMHPFTLALVERTGPLAVSAAQVDGGAQAFAPVAEAYGDTATVLVDVGTLPTGAASTVVDLSAGQPRVMRTGAIATHLLREVCPDLEVDA